MASEADIVLSPKTRELGQTMTEAAQALRVLEGKLRKVEQGLETAIANGDAEAAAAFALDKATLPAQVEAARRALWKRQKTYHKARATEAEAKLKTMQRARELALEDVERAKAKVREVEAQLYGMTQMREDSRMALAAVGDAMRREAERQAA